jgi:hypothetical protein
MTELTKTCNCSRYIEHVRNSYLYHLRYSSQGSRPYYIIIIILTKVVYVFEFQKLELKSETTADKKKIIRKHRRQHSGDFSQINNKLRSKQKCAADLLMSLLYLFRQS